MNNRPIDDLKGYGVIEWLNLILIVLVVLSLSLYSINQFIAYRYKVVLLQVPCDICLDANPRAELCLKPEYQVDPIALNLEGLKLGG